jgi:hypothetical protein
LPRGQPDSNASIMNLVPATITGRFFALRRHRLLDSLQHFWRVSAFVLLALAIAAGYAFLLTSFWAAAPGRPGIDENAYLIAGKNIALTGSPGFLAKDDFQFVDAMWIGTQDQTFAPPIWLPPPLKRLLTAHTESGWFYPKYPIGTPLLNALAIRIAGKASDFAARKAAFTVSPTCTTLAALGMCWLTMMVTESAFYGLLGMIVLITSPAVLQLAEAPNSHAPALFAVVWGMLLLMRFYRGGSAWWGAGGGLLLGFAVMCRYSEALLLFPLYPLDQVLSDTGLKDAHPLLWHLLMACRILPIGPVGIAAMTSIRWRQLKSYLRASVPVISWGIPVGLLLAFNWFSMGHLTGYDATHESGGFTSAEFLRKWDFSVQHIYLYGLFLFAPLGVAGLGLMFRRQRRDALCLTMWFLPGTLLYTSYYWGSQAPGMGYLRFLITVFPPLIIGAMWLLKAAASGWNRAKTSGIAEPLLAGFLTAAAGCIGLIGSLHPLTVQHLGNMNLALSAENSSRAIHDNGKGTGERVIFADEGLFPQFLQYAQFMVDGTWYASDAFEPRMFGGFGFIGLMQNGGASKGPSLVQPERIEHQIQVRRNMTPAMLGARERQVINVALGAGQSVFAILTTDERATMERILSTDKLRLVRRAKWTEPCNVPLDLPDDSSDSQPDTDGPRENLLVPPFDPGRGIFRWAPQSLAVYQILRAVEK